MIRFIAAIDSKHGVANEHGIPWQGKLPTDVAYFRNKTLHGTVMMGYGWYKEQQLPLPERRNLVATSNSEPLRPGFERVPDAREFLNKFKSRFTHHPSGVVSTAGQQDSVVREPDIWVGGGAGLFASTLDLADELYLTLIDWDFHCTKFFPQFEQDFEKVSESEPQTENGITFKFTVWKHKI